MAVIGHQYYPNNTQGHTHGACRPLRSVRDIATGVHFVGVFVVNKSAINSLPSLGNAAVFLIGGKTRDVEPIPLILRSGDVIIMSGPECRRAYHGSQHYNCPDRR